MSTAALAWALKQPIKPSSLKFLLVACADVTPERGLTYPSIAYLAEITSQDRKTVIAGLAELVSRGYLRDTEKRTGATKQIVVYELLGYLNNPENGTLSNLPNSTVFPSEQSRFSQVTVPKTVHGTPRELQVERPTKYNGQQAARFKDFWIAYPKKVKKKDAYETWKRKNLDPKASEILEDISARQQEDGRWLGGFIPDPTTYLRGERWNDEISPVEKR